MGSAEPANDSQYAQAQKAIAALQPADQKQILTTLQSDPKVKASLDKQLNKQPAATPAATPAASEKKPEAAGKKSTMPKKKVAPTQAEIDADRNRVMGMTSDSIIRKNKSLIENIDEAGLMAKLGTKVGQAAQSVGSAAGQAVGTVQQAIADPEHSKALVKAFAKGDTSADPNSAPPIQDSSGTVPRPIIDKINQLNLEQRAELHKLITQKTV
jgi:fructose-specific component phosphotransferase system IIB-like protein